MTDLTPSRAHSALAPDGDVLLTCEHLRLMLPSVDGELEALTDVTFTVRRAQTYALVGESGCGKSLTASTIMRLLPEEAELISGSIRFEGCELTTLAEREMRALRGSRIAMIFQEPGTALNPVMTVGAQIAEAISEAALQKAGRSRNEDVLYWLERVGLPEPALTAQKYPHELSGGQKQRILIAMALAVRPALIIADEPTTALDVTLQRQVLELLKDCQRDYGLSILLITHDLGVVRECADSLSLLYAGVTLESATVEEFFARPLHPYARALFGALPGKSRHAPLRPIEGAVPSLIDVPQGCRFAPRCPLACERCRAALPELVAVPEALIASASAARAEPHSPHLLRCPVLLNEPSALAEVTPHVEALFPDKSEGEPLLEIRGLHVTYGARFWRGSEKRVVEDVSLTVRRGETLALVGESGSGKTTTALAMLGLLGRGARVTGEVRLAGEPLNFNRAASLKDLRQRIQIVFQDPFASLDPRMRIRDTLLEGMRSLRANWSERDREARLLWLMDAVGLERSALERLPHAFSGGQRQRIAIARALAPDPEILVLDEPTSALDVSVQAQILNLLRRLQIEASLTYLFITHNFAVVSYMADQIAVMQAGRVVEMGAAEAVLNAPAHPYTRALIAAVPEPAINPII